MLNRMVSTLTVADVRNSSYGMLRKFIKLGFREEHVCKIVGLTKTLDDLVIVPRTANVLNGKLKQTEPSDQHIESPDAPDFAVFEKSLWYVIFCPV